MLKSDRHLRHLQAQFREKTVQKYYFALVMGEWKSSCKVVKAPLLKNEVNSIVRVNPNGKPSETRYKILEKFSQATLVQASPITGRTHQIRVHCQYTGHPIAWDDRYGDRRFDAYTRQIGTRIAYFSMQLILSLFIRPQKNLWIFRHRWNRN